MNHAFAKRDGVGGIVLSPNFIDVQCAYPAASDASIDVKKACNWAAGGPDDTCVPGCWPEETFCHEGQGPASQGGACPTSCYPPSLLKDVLDMPTTSGADGKLIHTAEVIVGTEKVVGHLPDAIEAFFFFADTPNDERYRVVEAWRDIWDEYDLVGRAGPPLLRLDLASQIPFSVVRGF